MELRDRECARCKTRDIPLGVDWPFWHNGLPYHQNCLEQTILEEKKHVLGVDLSFTQSFQAMDWAKAFVALVKQKPEIATDEATMLGWFANAIMRGYDERAWRDAEEARLALEAYHTRRTQPPSPEATRVARLSLLRSLLEMDDGTIQEKLAARMHGISQACAGQPGMMAAEVLAVLRAE